MERDGRRHDGSFGRILAWPAGSAKLIDHRQPRSAPGASDRARLSALAARDLVRAAAACAAASGTPFHLVGGAVRDALLGRAAGDLDGVVGGGIDRIAAALSRRLGGRAIRLGGDRFAAVRIVSAAGSLDLWDRGAAPLADDLWRRDLTLNAMALDPVTVALADPAGGFGDLRRGRLRATRPGVFLEDPLRVLRLARLAAELPGFTVEEGTRVAAREAAEGLTGIAAERIREELLRLLAASHADAGLALLATCGAESLFGEAAAPRLTAAAAAVARLRTAIVRLPALGLALSPEQTVSTRLALLAGTLAGSALGGRRLLAELAGYRWLARGPASEAGRILAEEEPPRDLPAARQFLHRTGELWAAAAARFAATSEDRDEDLARLVALEARAGADLRRARPLLPGEEIGMLTGSAPGPELGRWIARLRRAEVDGEVTSPEAARAWLVARAGDGSGRRS